MSTLSDGPSRFGLISRVLHWGMAVLFLLQFMSAAAHWALPRENALRELLWGYHANLGTTLFLLVMLRGVWAFMNLRNRPAHAGQMARAATAGHITLYALMVVVPAVRLIAAAGGARGLSYIGIPIFPARETAIAWTQVAVEWHGEIGWIMAAVVLGHIAMATIWHPYIQRDDVLKKMT